MVMAIKFNEDRYFSNEYYAKVGGVSCKELNSLEKELLQIIDYDLTISHELYEKYEAIIQHTYNSIMLPSSAINSMEEFGSEAQTADQPESN